MAPPLTLAWAFTANGAPRTSLTLQSLASPTFPPSLPLPKSCPAPCEWLLVNTSFAALNPGDIFTMKLIPSMVRVSPTVPGIDMVGTVASVWAPEGVPRRFKPGDKVVAFVVLAHILATGMGTLAKTVAIPAKYCVALPEGKTPREAAGLMLTGACATRLVEEAKLQKGGRVLVVGASGGIGTMAVQLARLAVGEKGFVVGVCSGRNADMVRGLGADEVVDYTEVDAVKTLAERHSEQPFDAILDSIGDQYVYTNCAQYMKEDGVYSAVGIKAKSFGIVDALSAFWKMQINAIWPRSKWLLGTGRTWVCISMMDPGMELMEYLVGLFAEGKLRVVVDGEWSFDRVLEAYDVLMSGRARGKIIVKVVED